MTQKTLIHNNDFYWNIGKTLSHNKLINVIVGNRGGGKSYGAKQRAIDNFLKNGEQFGYIRRYVDDLKKSMPNFFLDIAINPKYKDVEFKTEGNKFYIRLKPENEKEKWTDKDIAGYGFILSTANNLKSVSYPLITTLIFDEFLLDKGYQRYINDEPIALLNLYETVARPGTDHKRCTLFMLANAISVTNPYFLFWDLKMPTEQDGNGKWIWKHPTKPILVEDVRSELFIEAKKNTEFGSLIAGTKYEDYSIENKFLQDDSVFIEKKTGNCKYYFTFIYKGISYGVWIDSVMGLMYVSKDVDPSCPLVFSLTLKDHKPNTMLISTAGKRGYLKNFIDCYKNGCVRFESMNIKNLVYEVIKSLIS